mmetsp:Transcript_2702/g.5557  ORF Transcript_2702/g.5557 Transcript_2702/m.5557 type:complete len:300 (+) Transcript_2702:2054-2953(+)
MFEALDGELQLALIVVATSKVTVSNCKVRPEPDCLLVLLDGLLHELLVSVCLSLLLQSVPKVTVGVSKLRTQPDGLLVVLDRSLSLPHSVENPGKVAPSDCKIWPYSNCLKVALLGLLKPPLGLQQVTQVAVSVHEPGVQSERHLKGLNCVLGVPKLHVARGEVVVCVREAGLDLDCLEIELDRTLDISELLEGVAKVAVRLSEIGVDPDALLVVEDGLAQVSKLKVESPDEEQIVYPVGVGHVNCLAHGQCILVIPPIVKFLGLPHHPRDLTLGLCLIQASPAPGLPRGALLLGNHFV